MGLKTPDEQSVLPYFAYGSNMLSRRLAERCPSASRIETAHVRGYRLSFDKRSWKDGSAKCRMEQIDSPEDLVWGVLYGIEERDLSGLDTAEGRGRGYEIDTVSDEIGDGRTVSAFTYLADPGFLSPALVPFDWYVDLVVAGARENGLPREYVRQVREVYAVADPDRPRAELALRLLTTDREAHV